jgi:hypothetical protein
VRGFVWGARARGRWRKGKSERVVVVLGRAQRGKERSFGETALAASVLGAVDLLTEMNGGRALGCCCLAFVGSASRPLFLSSAALGGDLAGEKRERPAGL